MANEIFEIRAKHPGHCAACGGAFDRGVMIKWRRGSVYGRKGGGTAWHAACAPAGDEVPVSTMREVRDVVMKEDSQTETEQEGDSEMGSLETAIVDVVKRHMPPPSIDATEVRKIVVEEIDKRPMPQPRVEVIEVKRPDLPNIQVKDAHYLMPRLLRVLSCGFPVYLWGPAGTGKTTAALQAAQALGAEAEIDTLDPSTFRSMVQGYMTPDGKPVDTTFTRCISNGKVYVADECDNAPGHVQTLFNSALANGHAPLAWGNVAKHEKFRFIGTGNTPGRPTRQFPDRRPMSAAFADRLYFMYWPLDEAIEAKATGRPLPDVPERKTRTASPANWGEFVVKVREWAKDNMPTLMITPRATLLGLQALAAGETPEEVADALIFRGADEEIRRKALNAVNLPTK